MHLISVHVNAVKFWKYDGNTHKFSVFDCQLGHTKRFLTCLSIDKTDTVAYCGSRYGDILEIIIDGARFKRSGPLHRIFKGGVNQISTNFDKYLVLGCGDGSVARVDKTSMAILDEQIVCEKSGVKCISNSENKIYALTGNGTLFSSSVDEPLSTTTAFMTSNCNPVGAI